MAQPKKPVPEDCMPRCASCAFGEIDGQGGVCHRYPPVFIVDEEGGGSTFAIVAADDWCGEYRRALQS
jgi:hypothetical protein